MLGYRLTTARSMASHPGVQCDHKAFCAIEQRIPSLIIVLKIILTKMTGLEEFKDVIELT